MTKTTLTLIAACILAALAACTTQRAPQPTTAVPEEKPIPELPYEKQRRFDALFLEAINQKLKNNYDAEYELLNAALKLNPDAPEALYEKALLKLSFAGVADTLHRAEGDSLLRRAVEIDRGNKYYKETLGDNLAREGKYKEAAGIFEELARTSPDVSTLSKLVSLQEQAEDYQGAIATLSKLESSEGKNEAYSLEKFKIYNEIGDKQRAYAAIEELCAEYPSDLRYRVLLGDLYQQNGYDEMALDIYRDVLAAEPDNSFAQISLLAYYKKTKQDSLYDSLVRSVVLNPNIESDARLEAMKGFVADNMNSHKDSTEVLNLFHQALSLPQDDRSMAEYCAIYMTAIGMPTDSLAPVMRKILEIEPDYTRARLQLLGILVGHNDITGIIQLCHEGRMYDPKNVVFYYYESLALLQTGKTEEALTTMRLGTEQIDQTTDTGIASDAYATLGDLLHENGDRKGAYEAYEQALEWKGDNLMCLNNYAYFLSQSGERLDYAESMSRRTIKAEPENATFLDTYAWILFKMKRYQQARTYIDKTLKHAEEDGDNASLYAHAGDIYYRCGQRTSALRFWVKALSLSTDKAEKAELRRKIKRRRP